jgi:hypothetical protein
MRSARRHEQHSGLRLGRRALAVALPGKAGCVSALVSACTATRRLSTKAMALSRDGRNLYVASGEGSMTDRILVFRRAR